MDSIIAVLDWINDVSTLSHQMNIALEQKLFEWCHQACQLGVVGNLIDKI